MTPLARFLPQWPALSELLDEALSLPAAARADWLANLGDAQAEHREALIALLGTQARVETDDFLGELPKLPANVDDEKSRRSEHADQGQLVAGGLVGPYRLIEQIGRGGMGTVWLAERADGLVQRRVAMKLPHAAWGGALAERFARERDILAALEHEHIARLYDVGIDHLGRPYLAMEFVEGETIDAYCRTHDLPVRERIALLLQVMSAVAHAHARLVVHRDLKPSNILVTQDGQVRLLDFGIAKLLEGGSTRETALTELGGRALTLDYASPEQIRGEPLGTASDVYSMAVVAYEVMAQARPYRLRRGSAAELEEAIAATEPRLASEAATSKPLRRELRGDLDAILQRGLKKSIDERYPSIDAFAQDLERFRRGEPVLARPDRFGYRAGKFVRRHKWGVAMGAALALSVVTGSGASLWQAHKAGHQERLALLESDRQIAVAELYMETMSRLAVLAKDDPAELSKPNFLTAALRQQLQQRAPRYSDRPAQLEAQMKAVMLQLNFGNEFEASLAVGKEYLAHLKSHDAPPPEVIHAYGSLSRNLFQLQRFEECETMRRAAVAWAPETNDSYTALSRFSASVDLANILRVRGKRAEALAVLTRNEAIGAQRFPNNSLRSENLRNLALFWLGFDDARALQAMRQAHAGMLAAGIADDDLRAAYLRYLGEALFANGLGGEAETALLASAELYARDYGRTSTNAIYAVGRLASAIAAQGDMARAQALLDDSLRALAAPAAESAPAQARELRRRRIDIAWAAGLQAPLADGLSPAEVSAFTKPSAIGANTPLLLAQARLWTLAGRGRDALTILGPLRATWPDAGQPTAEWVQLLLRQAAAELAAGDASAARATSASVLTLLEQNDARAGQPYRVAAEAAALAAARLNDRPASAQALAKAEAVNAPFPSRVDAAESALRRGEVMAGLGRVDDAVAQGRAALVDLVGQEPESPRLTAARRLVEGG